MFACLALFYFVFQCEVLTILFEFFQDTLLSDIAIDGVDVLYRLRVTSSRKL